MRVQWVPHKEDMFLSWGNDISLHRVDADKSQKVADGSHYSRRVDLVATYSDLKYTRCLAACPYPTSPLLLAVGLTSGTVSLASISQNYMDLSVLNNFAPKHERQCNAVAWEQNGSNLLAVGLDKHRNDYSICVWDATGAPGHLSAARPGLEPAKPYLEIGNSESTLSLAWFKQPKVLVAGMNSRTLRVFDLRVRASDRSGLARYPVKPQMSAATRLVFGVCVDPFIDDRLATFAENQVSIWDRRNFEKPVITLTDARTKAIFSIGWSPTRQDLLSSLGKDSGLLKLHDINHYSVSNDEIEPTVAERYVEGCGGIGPLTDLSWHPTDENRIVVSSAAGKLSDFTIFERITMNWSPGFSFIWSNGGRKLNLVTDESDTYEQLEDISVVMRDRALRGYGVTERLSDNAALSGDEKLKDVWLWMAYSQQLKARSAEEGGVTPTASFQGVRSVLAGDGATPAKSAIELRSWIGVEKVAKCKVFRSESRDRALRLCGWGVDEVTQSALLDVLEKEGNFSRAAAVAVFRLTLRRAIQILRRSQDPQLKVVAMALSGFTNEKKALWHEISADLRPSLTDPYIRAIFSFLTADGDNYDGVLKEYGVTVHDRVAFACRFLPDDKLTSCLNHITQKLKKEANLQAILLTGVADEGLDVLQSYINVSGDVQTAALIASYAGQAAEPRVRVWIDSYRELLDLWRLWNQRARFDVRVLSQTAEVPQHPKQSVVTCNFCNKSVSAYIDDIRRQRQMARTGGTNSVKVMCCPRCRKPLPRCALCMIQLGTTASSWGAAGHGSASFDSWFTWCQTCRHGGHAAHMGAWFEEYAECPVTGCICKCMSLDSVSRVLPLANS